MDELIVPTHFPHEMYKDGVYRCIWSVEEHANMTKLGWSDNPPEGVEHIPLSAAPVAVKGKAVRPIVASEPKHEPKAATEPEPEPKHATVDKTFGKK